MKLIRNVLLLIAIPFIASAQQYKSTGEFDQYVQKAVAGWHVPGLAIIVIKDKQVVFKKGYGVLELGKPEKVNTHKPYSL